MDLRSLRPRLLFIGLLVFIGLLMVGTLPASALTIGSADNPFSNTCDGKAIGFLGPTGEHPRMELRDAPKGATLECRTGRVADIAALPFGPCDGRKGSQPFHVPTFTAEGMHRTEVRSVVGKKVGEIQQVTYYVHHSLDRVACCPAAQPDAAWFDAARALLQPTLAFDDATKLDNPFVTIAAQTQAYHKTRELLSLRRTFRLSADDKLLLIRRTMTSRTFAADKGKSCVGLSIAVPERARRAGEVKHCPDRRMSPFFGRPGVAPSCPSVFCTVTTCKAKANGCIELTHTFNRARGQEPWVVHQPEVCPPQRRVGMTSYECDAYVLDAAGNGVCLAADKGEVREVTRIAATTVPLGLSVLDRQDGPGKIPTRYVFSGKTRYPAPLEKVLYLPP